MFIINFSPILDMAYSYNVHNIMALRFPYVIIYEATETRSLSTPSVMRRHPSSMLGGRT